MAVDSVSIETQLQSSLESDLTVIQTENQVLKADSVALNERYSNLYSEHAALQSAFAHLQADSDALRLQYTDLQSVHATLESDFAGLKATQAALPTDLRVLEAGRASTSFLGDTSASHESTTLLADTSTRLGTGHSRDDKITAIFTKLTKPQSQAIQALPQHVQFGLSSSEQAEFQQNLKELSTYANAAETSDAAFTFPLLLLPAVMKEEKRAALIGRVRAAAEKLCHGVHEISTQNKMLDKIAEILQEASADRPVLLACMEHANDLGVAAGVYNKLYSAVKDSEQNNAVPLITRVTLNKQLDQDLLTEIVEFGFTKVHSGFKAVLEARKKAGGFTAARDPDLRRGVVTGFVELNHAASYICKSHWSQIIRDFEQIWARKDLLDVRYHGHLNKAILDMEHHVQEFADTYGSIDAHLLKNVLALNMIHTTTTPHLLRIRAKLETDRVLTNDSSKWQNATAQLDSVLQSFKNLEANDPDPKVAELMVKAPVAFHKCRKLLQDRQSDTKPDSKHHLSTAFLAG